MTSRLSSDVSDAMEAASAALTASPAAPVAPLPADAAAPPAPFAPPAAALVLPAWTAGTIVDEELTATELLTPSEDPAATGSPAVKAVTLPSTLWDAALVARLSTGLVRDRNRFVCMQLATMAGEQLSKATAARDANDASALRAARRVFLSTLEAGGELVGAAIHYPRAASKGDGGALFPHIYVELICINRPGKGYGSLLLQHVEAFALSNAEALLRAALEDATTTPNPSPAAACSSADAPAAASCAPGCTTCLRGVKLLSVESAQRFYAANGFSEPDACKEMFKDISSIKRGLLRAA